MWFEKIYWQEVIDGLPIGGHIYPDPQILGRVKTHLNRANIYFFPIVIDMFYKDLRAQP